MQIILWHHQREDQPVDSTVVAFVLTGFSYIKSETRHLNAQLTLIFNALQSRINAECDTSSLLALETLLKGR